MKNNNTYSDRKLICKTCNKEFIFSVTEQKFFEEKGFGAPVRCHACRNAKRIKNEEREAKRLEREQANNIDPNKDWYGWLKANWDKQVVLFGDKD